MISLAPRNSFWNLTIVVDAGGLRRVRDDDDDDSSVVVASCATQPRYELQPVIMIALAENHLLRPVVPRSSWRYARAIEL